MSAGCFSWCPLSRRRGKTDSEKEDTEVKSHEVLPEPTAVDESQIPKTPTTPSKRPPEETRSILPTTGQYVMTGGKQALKMLQSAAGFIPVPMMKEAIEIAINIMEACEEASAAETKIKELQDRVCNLVIVIVERAKATNQQEEEASIKVTDKLERDLEELLSALKTIERQLAEVAAQNRIMLIIFTGDNLSTVEDCLTQLATALERFKLANDLRDSELLVELDTRLKSMDGLAHEVASKVDIIGGGMLNVEQRLMQMQQSAALLPTNKRRRQQIPLKPPIFHGRDNLVNEIAQLMINDDTSRVCLLGPGGMGKTSVSLAVVNHPLVKERFREGKCIWIPCNEASSANTFIEILHTQLQIPGDQPSLEKIISEISSCTATRFIMLDNFETPWNAPGARQAVDSVLGQLAALSHISLLVTMRGTYPPDSIKWQSRNIQPTDLAASRRIYLETNPAAEGDPDVDGLLEKLGNMPFAIILMANLGKRGDASAKELLDAWQEVGPDMLSTNSSERSMSQSISLSVDSDFVKRDPNALLLLSTLSFLPAGTTKENLRWWAPTLRPAMIPSAIATLSDAALLVKRTVEGSTSPLFYVLPVIQSFMQQRDRATGVHGGEVRKRIQSSCCRYVLEHATRWYKSDFKANSKALSAEDPNIQAILLEAQSTASSEEIIQALLAFSWHRCDTTPSTEIAQYVVDATKELQNKRYLAEALSCLGTTYRALGAYVISYPYLKEAYDLFNTLPDRDSQLLGAYCGFDLVDSARISFPKHPEAALSLAEDLEAKCKSLSDNLAHAMSLIRLGWILWEVRQSPDALPHLHHAKTILESLGQHPCLSMVWGDIARLHYDSGRLVEAVEAAKKSWEVVENSSLHDQSLSTLRLGRYLLNVGRDTEAWLFLEQSFVKATQLGNRREIRITLDYMGYAYLRRGDYQNALGAYQAATGYDPDWQMKENIVLLKRKLANPEEIIGFRRPSIDIDESLFYPLGVRLVGDGPTLVGMRIHRPRRSLGEFDDARGAYPSPVL